MKLLDVGKNRGMHNDSNTFYAIKNKATYYCLVQAYVYNGGTLGGSIVGVYGYIVAGFDGVVFGGESVRSIA